MVFMTVHGTFLRIDAAGRLVHVAFDQVAGLPDLFHVDIPADLGGTRFDRLVADDRRVVAVALEDGLLAGCVVRLAPDKRTAGLLRDGLYHCALPGEPALRADRERQAEWETFLCLEAEDFATLSAIMAHDWVMASTGARIRRSRIRLDDLWTLHLDAVAVPLRANLPLAEPDRPAPHAVTVLTASGAIERLHLFRPLVVVCAIGHDAEAALCVASLFARGRFDGHLHALSDRPLAALAAEWRVGGPGFTVQSVAAPDAAGRAIAKFSCGDWVEIGRFQPVLVVDPEIVFDNDVEPLLCAIVAASLMTAIPAGGAPGHVVPGLVGVPSFATHGAAWRLLRALAEQAFARDGRDAPVPPDREVTDRLAASGGFDTATLRRLVREGWPGTEADPDRRLGALGFWPHAHADDRVRAMAEYLDCLDTADAARQGLATKRPMAPDGMA